MVSIPKKAWIVGGALLGGLGLALAFAKASGPALDKTLPPDVKDAVLFAFLHEKDPQKLKDFSASLLPTYPLASQALIGKALNLQRMVSLPSPAKPGTPAAPGRISSARVSGQVSVGNIFDIDNYTDAAGKVASTAVDVVTHPADTASGAWHVITHPSDSISDFGNALVDALHAIPGMDEAGELLKDFAKTEFGTWCLRIMATFGYYVMSPYLGAQLAAIAFALPGVVKAEPFTQAWIQETIDRTIKTANILLGTNIKKLGSGYEEGVEKALAENPSFQAISKDFSEQIGKANQAIIDQIGFFADKSLSGIQAKLKTTYGMPPDFSKLAGQAGQGVREDNAAAAYDLLAQTHYQTQTLWDPLTGEDILAHLAKARLGTAQNAKMQASVSVYKDPRTLSVQEIAQKRTSALSQILFPPARQKWVDYYLNQERYANAGVKAKGDAGKAVSFGKDEKSAEASFYTLLSPGEYYLHLRSSPRTRDFLDRFQRVLRARGIDVMGIKLLPGPGQRLIVHARTPYFVRLRHLPHLVWTGVQKVG